MYLASLLVLSIWALSACSVLSGAISEPSPVEIAASPTGVEYIAPTLPPVYTETPTATIEPTPQPSPTPFTVIVEESLTPEPLHTAGIPTPAFTFTNWERFEASRFGIGLDIPNSLQATVFGQNILIASPSDAEVSVPLNVELRVDPANSFRLPDGINPADPRSVLDGILREFEAEYDEVSMIRAVSNISVRSYPAAEAAARTSISEGDPVEDSVWYLAVIVHDETIVSVYASSPANTGGAYLAVAERITDSLEFLPEP